MHKNTSQNNGSRERITEDEQSLQGSQWLNLDIGIEEVIQEPVLEHLQDNPIGRLLRIIASLPEVRQEKVLRARREIEENNPEMERRLDVALDRILEELIAEE